MFIQEIESIILDMRDHLTKVYKEIAVYSDSSNLQEKLFLPDLMELLKRCDNLVAKVSYARSLLGEDIGLTEENPETEASNESSSTGNKFDVAKSKSFTIKNLSPEVWNYYVLGNPSLPKPYFKVPDLVTEEVMKNEKVSPMIMDSSQSVVQELKTVDIRKKYFESFRFPSAITSSHFRRLFTFGEETNTSLEPKSENCDDDDNKLLSSCLECDPITITEVTKQEENQILNVACKNDENLQKSILPAKHLLSRDPLLNADAIVLHSPELGSEFYSEDAEDIVSNPKLDILLPSLGGNLQCLQSIFETLTFCGKDMSLPSIDCDASSFIKACDLKQLAVSRSQYFSSDVNSPFVMPEFSPAASSADLSVISISTMNAKCIFNILGQLFKANAQQKADNIALQGYIRELKFEKENLKVKLLQRQQQLIDALSAKDQFWKRADFIISKERNELHQQIISLSKEKQFLKTELEDLKSKTADMANELTQVKHAVLLREIAQEEKEKALHMKIQADTLKYTKTLENSTECRKSVDLIKKDVNDVDDSISCLESSLLELKFLHDAESRDKDSRGRELEVCLITRDAECTALNENLKRSLAELDEKSQENIDLKQQLTELQVSSDNTKAMLTAELNLLQGDSQTLRKKLIKVTKEKALLWKRTDHLTYLQKSQASGRWMNDDEVTHCLNCKNKFCFSLRKHHCRLCGKIFCHSCANNWLVTAASRGQTRVCNDCYEQHRQLVKVVEDGSSVDSICNAVEDDDAVETPVINSKLETSKVSSPVLSIKKKNSAANSDTLNFDVITDEEIAKSLSSSSPYHPLFFGSLSPENEVPTTMRYTLTRTVDEIVELEEYGLRGEIWISAGMVTSIPVSFKSAPVEFRWNFTCENYSLELNILYQKSSCTDEECLLLPHMPLHYEEESVTFHVHGLYIFQLDNSYSRINASKVSYTLWAKYITS